ncbi:hypothetical protein K466DRAFT_168933 [Polyporus arcularius HHB13444]|uniref:Uncharacterized protein n=1 Tax=Polyporus arcularius HHB13444 TaxID=1314778 RepID=A0A5C3Q3J5_9APHY|nr:hypothetical protein K466DRAFT_168933 [Polyporus arcularius HHB13444]
MASSSKSSGPNKDKKRAAPEPPPGGSTSTSTSAGSSKFDAVSKAILSPFTSRKHDSAKILSDCACSFCRILSKLDAERWANRRLCYFICSRWSP